MMLADSNADYSFLLKCVKTMATKMDMPMINITIFQNKSEDKENSLVVSDSDEEKKKAKTKKKVSICIQFDNLDLADDF